MGRVKEQRVAILDMLLCGNTKKNEPSEEMKQVYKKVAGALDSDDIALFDAGFSLVDAIIHGINQCLVRLPKNCTFGRSPGEIPARTSDKGRNPSGHQAEVVRPLERQHGGNTLLKTEPANRLMSYEKR